MPYIIAWLSSMIRCVLRGCPGTLKSPKFRNSIGLPNNFVCWEQLPIIRLLESYILLRKKSPQLVQADGESYNWSKFGVLYLY